MALQKALAFNKVSLCGLALLAGPLVLTGCDQQATSHSEQQTMATLKTHVTYLDRSMLPPDSILTVQLADVSKMDVAAEVISEQTIDLNGAPPYQVNLHYESAKIVDRHRYSVSARIENQGQLLYTSTTHNNPFADELIDDVYKITVTKVAAKQPDVTLTNTYWKTLTIDGEAINVKSKEPFVQFQEDGSTHGFLGCNNFMGSYEVNQQRLKFKPLASTQKMCSEQMELEGAMSTALSDTAQFTINGEQLTLQDEQGNALATFAATYFN
ncbi:META domain-containing protein [Pseudoalteromonas mariniglutinosa]|uniref:META domain-containing protein n=1 Tax=Pseudoalteromonas mariniglutinosa TaxID=206042 RepID=UPI003850E4A6